MVSEGSVAVDSASDSAPEPSTSEEKVSLSVPVESGVESKSEVASESSVKPENDAVFTPELIEEMRKLEEDTMSLVLNPNCFQKGIKYTTDESVIKEDESVARTIASFLWDKVLPHITEQVRIGEVSLHEGRFLRDYLHQQGVNMRYLGKLAFLARGQELEDIKMLKEKQQRIQPMPLFWLDLLETEIAARVVKHILNGEFTANKHVRMAPGPTIAKLLNFLLGNNEFTVEQSIQFIESKDTKTKKNEQSNSENGVPGPPVTGLTKTEFWSLFENMAETKFGLVDSIFVKKMRYRSTQRVSQLVVLRRVCQLCGIRISSKAYDFSTSEPFTANNIHDLVAVTKSCEVDCPLPEARQLLDNAKVQLQHGNVAVAYDFCQEASKWIQQV